MYRLSTLTRVAALGAFVALGGCEATRNVLSPEKLPAGEIFRSYVAIGNSITAGYQSGGILDSTQRQSYAFLLAKQMGTQFHYPSLQGRGCTPPIANGLTGALYGTGSTSTTCDGRAPSSVTDILNNVAVPGARVLDPINRSTVASNPLTNLFLGGKSQVERAIDAHPTFATIWIGNNDVLNAAISGFLTVQPGPLAAFSPGIVSTEAQFETSYDAMIKQLKDSVPDLKGVLIGVVQASGAPVLSTGDTLFKDAKAKAFINFATGKSVTIHPNCAGSTSLLAIPLLIQYIANGTFPPLISCVKDPTTYPVGDVFVLDAAEQATLAATITGYNNYIKAKAAAIGFAYYDPNPLLAGRRATNAIPRLPNFSSTTATFGTLISLDGIHPAAAGQLLIANDLITVINAMYSTRLVPAS
ncbi:MAG: lipolytic protein family [Gemmatimonadetes bacterium]|nr:lipolytic protein family [Gemmatimonadota bacterium]